jgi:hypothetical protein
MLFLERLFRSFCFPKVTGGRPYHKRKVRPAAVVAMGVALLLVWQALTGSPRKQRHGQQQLDMQLESPRPHAASLTQVVSLAATSPSSVRQTALQRRNSLRKALSCFDDEDFVDSKGVTCAGWAAVDCTKPPDPCDYKDPGELERVRKACPVSCGNCSVITAGGDPMLKHNGRFVKFSLAPNRLTTLVSWYARNGDRLSILGSTLAHPTRTDNQWFNEIQLLVNATRILRVAIDQPDVTMKVELDGKELPFPEKCTWKALVKGRCLDGAPTDSQHLLKEFASALGHLSFTWSNLKEQEVADRPAKKILALFGAHTHTRCPSPPEPTRP